MKGKKTSKAGASKGPNRRLGKRDQHILSIRAEKTRVLLDALRQIARSKDLTIGEAQAIAAKALKRSYGPKTPEEVRKDNKKLKPLPKPRGPKNEDGVSVYTYGSGQTKKPGSHRNNH